MSVLGPDGGCPVAFEGCLTAQQLVAIEGNVARLRRYTEMAWFLCGPLDGGT